MKYQIYLAKDVSEVLNAISEGLNKKPSTLIKELLEDNFRRGIIQATQYLGGAKNGGKLHK